MKKKLKGMVSMKKILSALLIIAVIGGAGWFILLRPEVISQETLTQDFAVHRQTYEDIALYLKSHKISTEIPSIPLADQNYEGVVYEDTDAYSAFINGIYEIMEQDHDVILSDGQTVEFVYHSTGGMLRKRYGSVIYNGEEETEGKITVPLKADGWHLYIAQK